MSQPLCGHYAHPPVRRLQEDDYRRLAYFVQTLGDESASVPTAYAKIHTLLDGTGYETIEINGIEDYTLDMFIEDLCCSGLASEIRRIILHRIALDREYGQQVEQELKQDPNVIN